MTKVIFSKTDRFYKICEAVADVCINAAYSNDIEDYIDAALPVLDYAFPEVRCFGDTDTRRAAKIAVYEVLEKAKSLDKCEQFNFIEENIDCSMVLNDILHMVTCNSDEYEYEGNNAMNVIFEKMKEI